MKDLYTRFDQDASDIVTDTRNGEDTSARVLCFRHDLNKAMHEHRLTAFEWHQLRTMFEQALQVAAV